MTRISVVIPCYNAEKFLAEALASVMAQTLSPHEVIVVDDGSRDASVKVAGGFPSVKLIAQPENLGGSAARNRGVKEAEGELIAFLDADDIWEPHHLRVVSDLLLRHPTCALAFSLVRAFGDRDNTWGAALPAHTASDAFWPSWRTTIVPMDTVVMWRQVFIETGGFDQTLRHVNDFEYWLRVSRHRPFVCTHEVTARYRRYPGSVSSNIEACRRAEYRVRADVYAKALKTESAAHITRLEQEYRLAWEARCKEAWASRNSRLLRLYLELGAGVPGAGNARRRWQARKLLLPLVRLTDRLPPHLRRGLKQFPGIRTLLPPRGTT